MGALMVDGLGDGLVVECATEDTDYLRTTSFGLLQVGCLLYVWFGCGSMQAVCTHHAPGCTDSAGTCSPLP